MLICLIDSPSTTIPLLRYVQKYFLRLAQTKSHSHGTGFSSYLYPALPPYVVWVCISLRVSIATSRGQVTRIENTYFHRRCSRFFLIYVLYLFLIVYCVVIWNFSIRLCLYATHFYGWSCTCIYLSNDGLKWRSATRRRRRIEGLFKL